MLNYAKKNQQNIKYIKNIINSLISKYTKSTNSNVESLKKQILELSVYNFVLAGKSYDGDLYSYDSYFNEHKNILKHILSNNNDAINNVSYPVSYLNDALRKTDLTFIKHCIYINTLNIILSRYAHLINKKFDNSTTHRLLVELMKKNSTTIFTWDSIFTTKKYFNIVKYDDIFCSILFKLNGTVDNTVHQSRLVDERCILPFIKKHLRDVIGDSSKADQYIHYLLQCLHHRLTGIHVFEYVALPLIIFALPRTIDTILTTISVNFFKLICYWLTIYLSHFTSISIIPRLIVSILGDVGLYAINRKEPKLPY